MKVDVGAGPSLLSRATAEFIGTGFLVTGVVGSGIAATRLTQDVAIQLLANAAATAGVLLAVILAFAPASGAHFNPAVSLAHRLLGGLDNRSLGAYVLAQLGGGALGAIAANLMFGLNAIEVSTRDRSAPSLVMGEFVATVGLLVVIFGVVRSGRPSAAAPAVAGYIGGAYWFSSSTSFANPAVTIARTLSDTFSGIDPASVPVFLLVQLLAVGASVVAIRLVYPDPRH